MQHEIPYTIEGTRQYTENLLATEDQFEEENLGNVSHLQATVLKQATVPLQKTVNEDALILDIGCGNGKMTAFLQRFEVEGLELYGSVRAIPLDVSHKVLQMCREAHKDMTDLAPVVADGLCLPFKGLSYTGVLLCQVLEFLPRSERLKAVGEACRVVKPGGPVIVAGLQGKMQVEYSMDLTRVHETAMLKEPIRQTELFRYFLQQGFNIESFRGLSIHTTNDFFIGIFRRPSHDTGTTAQKGVRTETEEEEGRRKRAELWR